MSFKSYDFRCSNGHEFEDLASAITDVVPCPTCAASATQFWKTGTRTNIRVDSDVSESEKRQAFAQCAPKVKNVEDLPRALAEFNERVSTRSGLKSLLRENGLDMAVSAREFNEEIARIQALDEKAPESVDELNEGLTDVEIEQRRAETIETMKAAKEMVAAGTIRREIPADAPEEVIAAAAAK